jgi:hypothetical protein
MRKPILYLDFETSAMLVETYRFYEPDVIRIRKDIQIISVSWSWEGEDEIYHMALPDFKGHKAGLENVNDKKLVKSFSDIIAKAEYVVAHNGKGFDFRVWRMRLLVHGLDPMHNVKEIDTKQWAKKFYFSNNKQDNISRQIGTPEKIEHSKGMHYRCYELNDPEAWQENKEYNNRDVEGLKANARKLAPHIPNLVSTKKVICSNPLCHSEFLKRDKYWQVAHGWKIQWVCKSCGRYTTAGEIYPEKPTVGH